jgi:hypothetical protein
MLTHVTGLDPTLANLGLGLALILQKRRAPEAPFRLPVAVPVIGLVLALAALAAAPADLA